MESENVLISSNDRFSVGNLFVVQTNLHNVIDNKEDIQVLSPTGSKYMSAQQRRSVLNLYENPAFEKGVLAVSVGSYRADIFEKTRTIRKVLPVFLINGTLYAIRGADNDNVMKLVVR